MGWSDVLTLIVSHENLPLSFKIFLVFPCTSFMQFNHFSRMLWFLSFTILITQIPWNFCSCVFGTYMVIISGYIFMSGITGTKWMQITFDVYLWIALLKFYTNLFSIQLFKSWKYIFKCDQEPDNSLRFKRLTRTSVAQLYRSSK